MKFQTIDEVCGRPEGSFKKFLKKKEAAILALEERRRERIEAVRLGKPVPPHPPLDLGDLSLYA